eukprot:3487110-Alexandrium_andersonii.AAC.1
MALERPSPGLGDDLQALPPMARRRGGSATPLKSSTSASRRSKPEPSGLGRRDGAGASSVVPRSRPGPPASATLA